MPETTLSAAAGAITAWVIGAIDVTTIAAALLGGGMVTAVGQAFLLKPTKTDMITQAAQQAVAAANTMLQRALDENADLRRRVEDLETEVRDLREALAAI